MPSPFLKKILLKNFSSYRGETCIDPVPMGLIYIQALSAEEGFSNNGGGKSSLCHAIAWCYYGETSAGVNKDDLISVGESDVCVEIFAENLWVKRSKERGKSEVLTFWTPNMTNKVDMNLAQTQEALERELGLPKKIFFSSFFIDAKSKTTQLLTAKSSDRLKTLQEIFQEDRYKQLFTWAMAERKKNEKAIAASESSTENTKRAISEVSTILATLEKQIAEEEKKNQLELKEKLQAKRLEINNALEKAEEIGLLEEDLQRQYVALGEEDELFKHLTQYRAEWSKALALQKLPNVGDTCPTCKQYITVKAAQDLTTLLIQTKQKVASLEDGIARIEQKLLNVRELRKKLQNAHNEGVQKVALLKQKEQEYQEIQKKLQTSPTQALEEQKQSLLKRLRSLQESFGTDSMLMIPKQKDLACYTTLEEAFGPGGIPNQLLDRMRAYLDHYCNFYLEKLAGSKFKLIFPPSEGTFEITVQAENGVTNIKALSDGQRFRCVLAWCLGFRKAVMELFPSKIDMLVMNDCLETLDQEGEMRLQELLQTLTAEISHVFLAIPRIPESVEGSLIEIEFSQNISKIKKVHVA